VILSRQSGVSEVLSHALKVDFWDTQRMADLMINALLHDELRADLVQMAREELKSVRWEASAAEMSQVYSQVTGV
jgi:glycosyltransferase involved in cell wall biosynthesis